MVHYDSVPENYYPEDIPINPRPMPGPTSDAVYADYIQEERAKNILSQIDPDHLLAEISERIKGKYKDVYTKQWVKLPGTSDVSPLLVSNFISFLSSILNNNTTLSNFTEDEINRIMSMVIEFVVDDLRERGMEYGLGSNYSERTRIGLIVCASTFTTLKRALNGLESGRIFRVMKIGEHNMGMEGSGQSKGGLGEALKFWK